MARRGRNYERRRYDKSHSGCLCNDAAVALAEHLCGSEEVFVEKMNEKASQLGMKDTVFKNCNGLDEDGHITSAYDVAVMSRELMKHEMIFDYTSIWLDNLRDGKHRL